MDANSGTATAPCPRNQLVQTRNLIRMRNELICAMYAAQDYGLPEYEKVLAELTHKTNDDLKALGVPNPLTAFETGDGRVISR